MTQSEIRESYNSYLEETVEEYFCLGSQSSLYMHFRGVVYGLGFALGYKHSKITDDLNNAITVAKKILLNEAI